MDKDKAMKRIDAIEKEAQELRRIIEEKPKYDSEKIYVAVHNGCPYIMTGEEGCTNYRFHSFDIGERAIVGWHTAVPTGQSCLEYHIDAGFKIKAFDNRKDAFKFFLDNL